MKQNISDTRVAIGILESTPLDEQIDLIGANDDESTNIMQEEQPAPQYIKQESEIPKAKPKKNEKKTKTKEKATKATKKQVLSSEAEYMKEEMLQVLEKLARHELASLFLEPVPLEAAPEYDTIIKKRMDISTIRHNILEDVVTNPSQFKQDLLLIFTNAQVASVG